jgi:hypothetical protein
LLSAKDFIRILGCARNGSGSYPASEQKPDHVGPSLTASGGDSVHPPREAPPSPASSGIDSSSGRNQPRFNSAAVRDPLRHAFEELRPLHGSSLEVIRKRLRELLPDERSTDFVDKDPPLRFRLGMALLVRREGAHDVLAELP